MGIATKISVFGSLVRAKVAGKHLPLIVFWNITNRCNLRCKHCYGQYYRSARQELVTSEVIDIIDQLAGMGTRRICFSGGEPLVRDDLGEIIRHIRRKGLECSLSSNGVLVPERISEIEGIDAMCLSLDGDELVHDKLRGNGSFRKATAAIECVKERRIPLHVSTVLTKGNRECLVWLLEQAKKIGFSLQVAPLYHLVCSDHERENELPQRLTDAERKEAISTLISYAKRGYPVYFSTRNYMNVFDWPDAARDRLPAPPHGFKHIKCFAGGYFCLIEANGDMYPCVPCSGHHTSNCATLGVREAFRNIVAPPCVACIWACYNEHNLLLNLSPSPILNELKNTLRDCSWRYDWRWWRRTL